MFREMSNLFFCLKRKSEQVGCLQAASFLWLGYAAVSIRSSQEKMTVRAFLSS